MDLPPERVPIEIAGPSEDAAGLPAEAREDGPLVIDLLPLTQQCEDPEPDPINPVIVVCRRTETDQRLESADEFDDFGNRIPRAEIELSDNSKVSLDAKQKSVDGFSANAALVTFKVDF